MNHPEVPRTQGRHAGAHAAPTAPGPGIAGAEGAPMLEQSSLEQVIARFGPMSPQQAAVVGVAVLDQLVVSHRQGMLHGDVRPGSVLLGPYEQIILSAPSLPSPLFTSPEGVTSPAADLWSLGATLYTAVEGRPPSPGGSLDNAGPIAPVLFHLLAADPSQRPDPITLRGALIEVSQYRPGPPAAPPPTGALPSTSGGFVGGTSEPGASDPPSSSVSSPSIPFPPSAVAATAAFGQTPPPGPGTPGAPGAATTTGPQRYEATAPLGGPGVAGRQEDEAAPSRPGEETAPFRKTLTEQMSDITAKLPQQDVPVPPQVALSSSPGTPIAWQNQPSQNQPSPQQRTAPGLPPQGQPHQGTPQQGQPHPGAPFPSAPTPPHQNPQDAPTSREPAPLPVPTPPGASAEPSERTTGVLVPRPVVALTGALLFGMAVTIGVLLTSIVTNADDTVAAEPSGAKGRFATAPRACGLLDDDQVSQVVPGYKSSEVEHSVCNWLNQHDWRKPNVEKYDLRVRLIAQKQDGSEVMRAREYLAGKKKDLVDKGQFVTPKPLPPKDLRGVGEEAFTSGTYNAINLYNGSYKATVVFRVSNLIAEVEYERGGVKEDPDGKIAEGALRVARWLNDSLKTDD
ncbi:hypothetical protein ABT352_21270 [Streptosporangium sp. NPDC000563]|uniref:hypothetical protein n=1 Tax=unclassified Streptosporangium TaxID=2632669 RepID=UPI00331978B2